MWLLWPASLPSLSLSEHRNPCQSLTSGSLDQREAALSLVCKRPRPAASQAELVCQWVCASGLQDPAVPTSRILIQHQNRQLCLFEMTVSKDGFIIQKKYGIPHPHPYPHLPSTETINTTTGASTVCHRARRNAQVGERRLSAPQPCTRTEKRKMQATSSQLLRWGSLDATLQKPEHPVPLQNFKTSASPGGSTQASEPARASTWPGRARKVPVMLSP